MTNYVSLKVVDVDKYHSDNVKTVFKYEKGLLTVKTIIIFD